MSPTVLRYRNYRFFFFSREETRMHVHVSCPEGEARFWLEPAVEIADHYGLSTKQLKELQGIVERERNEIVKRWHRHFKG